MKKKIFLSALAVVLAAMIAAAGTIAWLSTRSETVKNTFTVGDINITLDEAKVGEEVKRSRLKHGLRRTAMTSYLAIHMIKTRPSLSLQIVRIAGCSSRLKN